MDLVVHPGPRFIVSQCIGFVHMDENRRDVLLTSESSIRFIVTVSNCCDNNTDFMLGFHHMDLQSS